MPQYRVIWEIDIEAGTPEQAARQALEIQRDPESAALAFEVRMQGPCPRCKQFVVHKKTCALRGPAAIGGACVDYVQHIDLMLDGESDSELTKTRVAVHAMGVLRDTLCGIDKRGGSNPVVQSPAFSTVTCKRCLKLLSESGGKS